MRKNWAGKPFINWCQANPDDKRKIVYSVRGIWDGKQQFIGFTSEDDMEGMWLFRLQNSRIERLELIGDVWHVELVY